MSAGSAAVLDGAAMVISDGRYTIQLVQQVDARHFTIQNSSEGHTLAGWLAAQAAPGTKNGYDPRVITAGEVDVAVAGGLVGVAVADGGSTIPCTMTEPVMKGWMLQR